MRKRSIALGILIATLVATSACANDFNALFGAGDAVDGSTAPLVDGGIRIEAGIAESGIEAGIVESGVESGIEDGGVPSCSEAGVTSCVGYKGVSECDSGACDFDCQSCGCKCPAYNFPGGTTNAVATCGKETSCVLACDGKVLACDVTCAEKSSCNLNCQATQTCAMHCSSGSQCLLMCGAMSPSCDLDCPGGTKTLCKDKLYVCNRACP